MKRVVLIGFRGVGKSTLAKTLAAQLSVPLISTDTQIEAVTGMPISQFVAANGWPKFREIEQSVIAGLPENEPAVIDCGGGVIENPENMRQLAKRSLIVWVDCEMWLIYQRLSASGDRPLLNEADLQKDIESNYNRRLPLYRQYAQLKVDTTETAPELLAETIIRQLNISDL